jgi:hypothetical protein
VALLTVCAASCVLSAVQAAESFTLANELGMVIASEQFCQLTFKQEAIQAFVEKRVPADDMSFPPTLNLMIQGAEFNMQKMSPSARTAHCAQIRRLAVSYGFVEK